MQARQALTLAGSLLLGAPAVLGASLDQRPSFDQVYQSGDAHLLVAWGRHYEHGIGAARDPLKALKLYCKAARKGDVEAKFSVGQIYAFGRGVPADKTVAAVWLHQAAEAGERRAANLLKVLKIEGKPKGRATCPLGSGGTDLASRPHPASGEIARLVRALAPRYRLDPNLVLAVVEAESNFNPRAVSVKNAQGLMQLIPATAKRFGVEDVWDPEQNLNGGMAYLRWLLDYFDGDVKLALAGYNAGERAVERHGGVPPYAETRAYVEKILRRIGAESTFQSS